ncbi:MAG TPA: cupin domain-containing protein [Gaiellaceae bacterium]|nr:cupin domain-containing protein [Gaiellaceae bacterium]
MSRSGRVQLMVPEARLESTEHGLVPDGDGWFVVNARDACWTEREGQGVRSTFEGETEFSQLGINLRVLEPGQPMAMYHWEADQEDFLVLSGEALAIVEGEERALRAWDFLHCPADTKHTIVGAGDGPCVLVAVGARQRSVGPNWGGYTVDEAAQRHGAGVDEETSDPDVAYAPFPKREPASYRDGWLPG